MDIDMIIHMQPRPKVLMLCSKQRPLGEFGNVGLG